MDSRKTKKLLKKHFAEYFAEKGFNLYSNNCVCRISDEIFQGMLFRGSAYGDSVEITVFVMPLFIKSERLVMRIEDELGELMGKGQQWWDFEKNDETKLCRKILKAIDKYAIPFLEQHNTAKKIENDAIKNPMDYQYLFFELFFCSLWNHNWEMAKKLSKQYRAEFESDLENKGKDCISDFEFECMKTVSDMESILKNEQYDKIQKLLEANMRYTNKILKMETKMKPFVKKNKSIMLGGT